MIEALRSSETSAVSTRLHGIASQKTLNVGLGSGKLAGLKPVLTVRSPNASLQASVDALVGRMHTDLRLLPPRKIGGVSVPRTAFRN